MLVSKNGKNERYLSQAEQDILRLSGKIQMNEVALVSGDTVFAESKLSPGNRRIVGLVSTVLIEHKNVLKG